ncbi:MAG: hypothetical protein ACKO0Z_25005 [Betaproteobacteria bacterium]
MTDYPKRTRRYTKVGAMSYAKLLKNLIPGTLTCTELAEATGLHVLTVYDYTKAMYKEKVIHITDWDLDAMGRETIRIYRFGPGTDAKPTRKPRSVISAEYRARKKHLELMQRMAA